MVIKQKGLGLIGVLLIIGAFIIAAGGVVVWQNRTPPMPTPSGVKIVPPLHQEFGRGWVQISPIQCFWNPWEKDWLEAHEGDTSKYPQGNPLIIEEPEAEIIRNYYREKRIEIFDVRSVKFENTAVCRACHCPQGYTLFLLISDSDVDKMIDLGYKVVE